VSERDFSGERATIQTSKSKRVKSRQLVSVLA